MTTTTMPSWEAKCTDETRMVEERLIPHFEQVDAYRYNSASIRVRVIHYRFEGMKREQRDTMVEVELDKLPIETQNDIVTLYTLCTLRTYPDPEDFPGIRAEHGIRRSKPDDALRF